MLTMRVLQLKVKLHSFDDVMSVVARTVENLQEFFDDPTLSFDTDLFGESVTIGVTIDGFYSHATVDEVMRDLAIVMMREEIACTLSGHIEWEVG